MSAVLVADRDWNRRRVTVAAVRYGGFDCDTVASVKQAASRLRRRHYAGILIDPGGDGATKLATLRARTDAAIIVVADDDDRDFKVACLNAGADDYIVRPFDTEELLARLHAVMRRVVTTEDEPPIVTADFTLDLADRHVIHADGTEISLSPIEWKLVETLVRRSGHLVTREELLASVWGPDAVSKTQYLRVHMASIRQKLEPDSARPRYFVTAPGLGLRFDPATDARTG
jgi:two-component system KDP operon response regulator KdpE